ncbi:MAG: sigma-54-dependent Fis family transcriptional regulator [Deltaproteobacteria bacterium]|nr:sigma-54-dependent Fis family transcriptional regulator [Deltaproteobacteria bacterium]
MSRADAPDAPARVLVVDDVQSMCEMLAERLPPLGFTVTWRTSGADALAALAAEPFDAVVTDINMREMDGLELCARIVAAHPEVPVMVITAFGNLEAAIAAMRAGAYDFLTKPFDIKVLALSLERAVQHRRLKAEVKRLRERVADGGRVDDLVGTSSAMREVYSLIDRVADTDSSVLVAGETGTGKELVARALHERSRRRRGPFVAINCAAVPDTLIESELFGHARGAFTDARTARAGLLVQANGGTLFLDEIGELPLALQPKLLRVLQERKVRPVGGDTEVPFDVRLVSATNADLEGAVEEKRFREDLYFRINVITIPLPPLRARGGDVLLLAQHFLERAAANAGRALTGIAPEAARLLLAYPWPGNARELHNCMERAVALARYDQVTVADLPERIQQHRPSYVVVATDDPSELVSLEEMERRYILRVMEAVAGNKTMAAQILKMGRKTLYRKLERYGGE